MLILKKGFGDETPTLQIDLEAFFRGFGEIDSLRLRRTDTGLFKGSVISTIQKSVGCREIPCRTTRMEWIIT